MKLVLNESYMPVSAQELADFMKGAVKGLLDGDATLYWQDIDGILAVCVGWSNGYGNELRDDVIQDEKDPDWGITAGLKVITSDDMRTDFDYLNFPYYEDGEVEDISVSISFDEDYLKLSKWFIEEAKRLQEFNIEEDGKIILDIDEAYANIDPEYVIWVRRSDNNKWVMWGGSHKASVDSEFLDRINKRAQDFNQEYSYTDVQVVKNGENPIIEAYANIDPEDDDVREYKYKGQPVYRIIATRMEGDRSQMFVIGMGTKLDDTQFEPIVRSARYTTEESFLFLDSNKAEKFLKRFKKKYPDAETKGMHVAEYNPISPIEKLIPISSPCGKAYLCKQKDSDKKKDESLNEAEEVQLKPVNSADEIRGAMEEAIENFPYDPEFQRPNYNRVALYSKIMADVIEYPLVSVDFGKDYAGKHLTWRMFCSFGQQGEGIKIIFNGGAIFDNTNRDDTHFGKGIGQFYFEKSPDNQNTHILFTPWTPKGDRTVYETYTYVDEFEKNFKKDYVKFVKKVDPETIDPRQYVEYLKTTVVEVVEEDASDIESGYKDEWETIEEFESNLNITDALARVKKEFSGDILREISLEELYDYYLKYIERNYPNY